MTPVRSEAANPALLLGTSGWSYKDWVGNVYPSGTGASGMLRAYAARFRTVEIDSTFYGIPRASTVERWHAETPDDFVFAAKFPQTITHEKMLEDCREDAAAFVDRMSLLGDKLGPLLLQFPYGFKSDRRDLLDAFLDGLPPGYRYAVEVRHKSWLQAGTDDMLRRHGAALALIDHPWMPKLDTDTAPFTYIRWLGDRKAVTEPFDAVRVDRRKDLARWVEIVRKLAARGLVIYGYFNNHYAGHSPSTLNLFLDMFYGISPPQQR